MVIQVQGIKRLLALLLTVALASTTLLSMAAPADARLLDEKTGTFYFVGAHPDDESMSWQMLDDYQEHYSIFVTMTRGEGTNACLTKEQSQTYHLVSPYDNSEPYSNGRPTVGPYQYEGPNSPVGEKDHGERHPLGNPWVGWGTQACKDARTAAWHWFLDDAAQHDPGFPDFGISATLTGDPRVDDDYQGKFCPDVESDSHPSPKHTAHPGADPMGKHAPQPPPWDPTLGCVEVWADAKGARVAFDLGDGANPYGPSDDPYTEQDVVAALQLLRARRADWGIAVSPEVGMIATAPGCDLKDDGKDAHGDHETIQDALYAYDFGTGPQYGVVCDGNTNRIGSYDPGLDSDRRYLESPGAQEPPDVAEWWTLNSFDPVTYDVTGTTQVNYGYLADRKLGDMEGPGVWDFPLRTTWKRFD